MAFPGETTEYRTARDRLLQREIELRREMEAVAAERRALPPGGGIPEDYAFEDASGVVRLSELFAPGRDSLVIYSFMFPRYPTDERPGPATGESARLPREEAPCPSCVGFLDQLDGAVEHAGQLVNFAVIAKAPVARLLTFGRERGWRRLRLLSSNANTYHRDYGAETEDGHTMPILNVFERDGDTIRHFWSSELFWAPPEPGQDPRHNNLLEPFWNMLDLTREGRPEEWDEQLSYPARI